MRIGVDINPLRPPYTGVSNYELWLLDALISRESELHFLGYSAQSWVTVDQAFLAWRRSQAGKIVDSGGKSVAPPALRQRLQSKLIPFIRRAPGAHRLVAYWRGQVYAGTVGAQKIDLFHAFMYRAPTRHSPVPVIPVVYDLSHVRFPEMHYRPRIRWMRWVEEECREAPVVHTISHFTAQEISTVFGVPRHRIHVIPPAVADVFRRVPFAKPSTLAAFDLQAGTYALTVSTLEPRKNLKTLLTAYAALTPQERSLMPLVVVGAKGWGDAGLVRGIDVLIAEGSLRFAGYVTDEQLATLYAGARVMVYPSVYEGFGMPITEALACGAPVVVSNAASLPEAAGGVGMLVEPLDVDGWRDALRRALRDGTLADPAACQRRREHATAWTWADAASHTAQLYRVATGGMSPADQRQV
jgi:alpha-1,3-rhamnosyl/mannosyltransferase